jgi:hypothetical protein
LFGGGYQQPGSLTAQDKVVNRSIGMRSTINNPVMVLAAGSTASVRPITALADTSLRVHDAA